MARNRDERYQVDDLDAPEAIRPAAKPVDTYYVPTADEIAKPGVAAKWAKDLSEGLEAINPAVNRFAASEHKRLTEEEIRKGVEARSRNKAAFKDAVTQGLIPEGASPWFKKGYEQQHGRLEGMEYDLALRTAWSKSPIQNSDDPRAYDKFVTDFRKGFMGERQGAASNPDWFEGFTPYMNRAENNLSAQHISHRQHEISKAVRENTYREIAAEIDLFDQATKSMAFDPSKKGEALDSLGAKLSALVKDQVANGLSGSDANKEATDAIIAKARELRNPDYLKIGESIQTPGGSLSGTKYFKDHKVATEKFLSDWDWNDLTRSWALKDRPHTEFMQQASREGAEYSRIQHARSLKENDRQDAARWALGEALSEVSGNASRPLDPKKLQALDKLQPGLASQVSAWQQHLLTSQSRVITNRGVYIDLLSDMQANPDTFDVGRIWKGAMSGFYDEATATTLFNQYKSIHESSLKDPLLRDPIFKERHQGVISTIERDAEGKITGASSANAREAAVRFYTAVRDFPAANPKASEADKHDFMAKKYYELIQEFNPGAADYTKVIQQERAKVQAAKDVEADAAGTSMKELIKKDLINPQGIPINSPYLRDLQVGIHILRAYRESVVNGDAEAQAAILERYPELAGKKKGSR